MLHSAYSTKLVIKTEKLFEYVTPYNTLASGEAAAKFSLEHVGHE